MAHGWRGGGLSTATPDSMEERHCQIVTLPGFQPREESQSAGQGGCRKSPWCPSTLSEPPTLFLTIAALLLRPRAPQAAPSLGFLSSSRVAKKDSSGGSVLQRRSWKPFQCALLCGGRGKKQLQFHHKRRQTLKTKSKDILNHAYTHLHMYIDVLF